MFSDFGTFKIWYIDRDHPSGSHELLPEAYNVTTFGEDLNGELYFNRFFQGSIYKITPGPGASDTEGGPSSSPFRLSVFPHPVVNSGKVYFESEAGQVRISAYDLFGREVAVLFDEPVGPGAQRTVEFDAGGLASGMYIVRMEARGEVETKKMVVVH